MLLGRWDVFNERKAEADDIYMGYRPRQSSHRYYFQEFYDQVKCCNFQYKLLEVSCLSSVGRGWSLKVRTDFLQCFRKQIKKVTATGK